MTDVKKTYRFWMQTKSHGKMFKDASSFVDATDEINIDELKGMIQLSFYLMLRQVSDMEFETWWVEDLTGKLIGNIHNELAVNINKHGKPVPV